MHETWDDAEVRRDMAQVALDSLGRQKREMDEARERQEALLLLSWIVAATGWGLLLLRCAGCF